MTKNEHVRVAVVCGGPSAEATVSRNSAKQVIHALRESFAHVSCVELDDKIVASLAEVEPHVVFPVLHGPPGEDGTFQGFLDILGYSYIGSGVLGSSCAMNKVVAKGVFRAHGLPVARDVVVHRREGVAGASRRIAEILGEKVVVKPATQGSALGVYLVSKPSELERALQSAFELGDWLLIEELVVGLEITAGVLEREETEALPVCEIRTPAGSWYDYEHRYTPGLSEHIIPAPLPVKQYERVQEVARAAHEALGCRDLSRVDFVVPQDGEPVLLEVNTIPGMTGTSLYPDEAKAAGISFVELMAIFVQRAYERRRA